MTAMRLYRVEGGGPVTFPPGTLIAVDDTQLGMRRAGVEIILEAPGKGCPAGRHVVRVRDAQQFKVGEVIGTESMMSPYHAARLVAIEPEAGPSATAAPADHPPATPVRRRR